MRACCDGCRRPLRACWCGCVQHVDNRTPVLILQHPSERDHPKGTAALLRRCLARCSLLTGERHAPPPPGGRLALLYPHTPSAARLEPGAPVDALIVLDGTWRHSRKLMHLNPWLGALPRLSLDLKGHTARYRIRRAHAAHQLSTLEAGMLALEQLESDPERYAPLHQVLEDFMRTHQKAGWPEPAMLPSD